MEWTIVGVIVTLVGLFFTCAKPVMSLQKSLTALDMTMKNFQIEFQKDERILEVHEEKIQDHEIRLTILEQIE